MLPYSSVVIKTPRNMEKTASNNDHMTGLLDMAETMKLCYHIPV